MANTNLIFVGAVQGAFGVKGEIRLKSFTDIPADIFKYAPFLDGKGAILFEVNSWRAIKDGFAFITKQGITREQAMTLRNTKLYVPRENLPKTDEDDFYHVDLIGLEVQSILGENLGTVTNVIVGAQDILEIANTPNTKKSWLLPFTKANVPVVDLANKRMVCDVPDGLIEYNDETA
jgi:16S rRNA processing protein RimM